MMANQERLELVLQATDKASAQLQAVRKEIELARGSTDGTARSSLLAAQNQEKVGNQARRSAAAMSSIAFAAQSATLGTRGAVMAVGQLAEGAALGSARMAMFAPHIAAAVVVAGTLVTLFQRMNSETAKVSKSTEFLLQNVEDEHVDGMFRQATQRRAAAAEALASLTTRDKVMGGASAIDRLEDDLAAALAEEQKWAERSRDVRIKAGRQARDDAKEEAKRLQKEQIDLAKEHEATRAKMLFDLRNESALTWARARGNESGAERMRIEQEHAERLKQIEALTTVSEARQTELKVDAESLREAKLHAIRERNRRRTLEADTDMRAGSDDPTGAFRGRMDQILMERDAQIEAGVAVATADDTAERKRRALRLETARAAVSYLKIIEDATMGSSNKQVRAIGLLANTIRRLHIGAEASLAAVESARAFGKVPHFLATHQYGSAALSALAGTKLAAAAALGFRESLGGGGSGGAGSGGGGGSATEASRFEPSAASTGVGSGVTINLITRDPYGRESIQQTLFSLERAGVLKTPAIEIPPTNGLVRA